MACTVTWMGERNWVERRGTSINYSFLMGLDFRCGDYITTRARVLQVTLKRHYRGTWAAWLVK